MATSPDDSTRALAEDRKWQRRTLPFMIGALAAMGVVFFAATILHFRNMQSWLEYKPPDIQAAVKELEAAGTKPDQTYREWYGRMLLEAHALNQRYRQNAAVVYSRVWNGYMGFLTGMVLALSGCVFILGKLREGVNFTGEAASAKWTLITSSPGIVLALAGSALVAISLKLNVKVESEDRPVYLPQVVEIAGQEAATQPTRTLPPRDLTPGGAPAGTGGETVNTKPTRELPPDVRDRLKPKEPGAKPAEPQ